MPELPPLVPVVPPHLPPPVGSFVFIVPGRKWYAVRRGFQTGIFLSWAECECVVKGFGSAEFRGFRN